MTDQDTSSESTSAAPSPSTTTVPFEPEIAPFPLPIDVSKVHDEKGVKKIIKQVLNHFGWFTWMPAANGFGQQGVSDHMAIKTGVFLAVEAKFGNRKPRPTQKAYAAQIMANDGFAFCVNERNVDHLVRFLESFEVSRKCQMKGQPTPDEHGSRMLNAIAALTDPYAAAK